VLAEECEQLNEAFNHWVVHRTPFVTVKAAMTMDGKIATARGESKWITGRRARGYGMKLRQGADAVLVGINTVLADDPSLTVRGPWTERQPRRIVLDAMARTPLSAKLVTDQVAHLTTIVVGKLAPKQRVRALSKQVNVLVAPAGSASRARSTRDAPSASRLDLSWVLLTLGAQDVTSLLVEGGGEVNASFLLLRLAHRVAFFYAPKVLGGRDSIPAVAGAGARSLADALHLTDVEWRSLGPDLLLNARVVAE
jgi:diaminohydroxyphosphoribosylaminopyrimidine deaminase/5-amino-6-(5-phosphoribosylamino)uracil reductase